MTSSGDTPCLEHRPHADAPSVRVPLDRSPFRIGRSPSAELVFASPRISKLHAEIVRKGGQFLVRDLQSRNGTFVNGERVDRDRPLAPGDILQVAHRELRFVLGPVASSLEDDATLSGSSDDDEEKTLRSTRDLYRILHGRTVRAVFQAIVELEGGAVVGYEALGRHTLPQVTYDATTLFRIASERGRADELSRLMRQVALVDAASLPARATRYFMNVHPDEMRSPDLLDELQRANEALGDRILVAEIHEAAIAAPAEMRALKAALHARGIELAYDDFGAGRSRLMELAEVPPDFLKLDMGLVRDIDASPARQDLVSAIVRVMTDAGIGVVAEGIETRAERDTSLALGCRLGQGYYFRHPLPVDDLRDTRP